MFIVMAEWIAHSELAKFEILFLQVPADAETYRSDAKLVKNKPNYSLWATALETRG